MARRYDYSEDEEHRMDRAEDAYLRHRIGEREAAHNPPRWQPWAMSTNELYAQAWLDSHDETGWDHDDES